MGYYILSALRRPRRLEQGLLFACNWTWLAWAESILNAMVWRAHLLLQLLWCQRWNQWQTWCWRWVECRKLLHIETNYAVTCWWAFIVNSASLSRTACACNWWERVWLGSCNSSMSVACGGGFWLWRPSPVQTPRLADHRLTRLGFVLPRTAMCCDKQTWSQKTPHCWISRLRSMRGCFFP